MSPTDKNNGTASADSKKEKINHNNDKMKQNGTDQSPVIEPLMNDVNPREPETADVNIPEHGTVTNIPFFTAKSSTLKCSDNDQMKMFDPGESSNNENISNNQNGCPVKFPIKSCNAVAKNKNYKAGSKINKLADMLAKRSQNIVEMTQNVTSDVIADIICAPKVESKIDKVDSCDLSKNEDNIGFSDVFCEKTASNQPVDCFNESQTKSVPNDSSENITQLQPQLSHSCSNMSELSEIHSQETAVSGTDALKEHLTKSETDGSTKPKKGIRKNLKNIELSLILPEKKRRSSPRNKLVNSDVNKECVDESIEGGKSSAKTVKASRSNTSNPINDEEKSFVKVSRAKKTEKVKSGRQRKSKRLVETSTQTSTTDFVSVEVTKSESEPEAEAVLSPSVNPPAEESKQFCLGNSELLEKGKKSDSAAEQTLGESRKIGSRLNFGENIDSEGKKVSGDNSGSTEDLASLLKSECGENIDVKPEMENTGSSKCVYACFYCTESFISKTECKDHEKSHSPKKNKQITKCQFCNKQCQSFYDLKMHCIKTHASKYAYCSKCDERFCEKSQLYSHNKLFHLTKATGTAQNSTTIQESSEIHLKEKRKDEIDETKKSMDKKTGNKSSSVKSDLKVDVSFDSTKKSSTSPRAAQKVSPRENKTEEQLLEMEMLFYSHLSGNIKENLTNHLDGKIDKNGNPIQTDVINNSSENSQKVKSTILLSVVASNSSGPSDQVSRAPSPYQTRSKTPNPLTPTAKKFKKLPNWQQKFWEKYNFPTNYRYDHRFWDKNYFSGDKSGIGYLKDLSCLDIKTQLTMRENIKKLDSIIANEENNKAKELSFPEYLCLIPKVNDESSTGNGTECGNSDCLPGKSTTSTDEKKLKSASAEINKSRRKNSADNSTTKRQIEKNSSKSSDCIKMMTRRQSVIELNKGSKKTEEVVKKRKGSLDATETQKMTLRRQTSLDNLQKICPESNIKAEKGNGDAACDPNLNENDSEDSLSSSFTGLAEISGEWVRPRSYLCGTCCAKFTNLWELEDHKWVSHPNVWCTHYEFEDEKIDKLFHRSDNENSEEGGSSENSSPASKLKLTDLYKRYLLPHGSLKTAKLVPNMSFPEQCTKCKKSCMSLSEMHKHMLDCGGDTTWFLTMYSSPMTIKRKWRPFGSRRRKQIGRRVIKRNIPNSSNIRPYHYQHRIRTKPGDVETIQKMLANLPEKRARRAINFDEIKTRSQATIHSNRLLRKRFKVSFGTNMMRLKALKQQRQVKSVKKENISTTDTSSENTPMGSPKRKNKQRENIQVSKEENFGLDAVQESEEEEPKKKSQKQNIRKESTFKQGTTKRGVKKEEGTLDTKKKKPSAKSSLSGTTDANRESFNKKKKGQLDTSGKAAALDPPEEVRIDDKEKKNKQKTSKKKKVQKLILSKSVKKLTDNDVDDSSNVKPEKETAEKKTKTEIEEEILVKAAPSLVLPGDGVIKKGKKAKLTDKNILRLKSNDKEKTELIKRIRKKLKNSKKILEKRENKDKKERRRSLRIQQTLQLAETNLKTSEETLNTEKNMKNPEEVNFPDADINNSSILNFERDTPSSKKTSKIVKNLKAADLKCSSGESLSDDALEVRRSSRTTVGPLIGSNTETPGLELNSGLGEDIKTGDSLQNSSLETSRPELAETVKAIENAHDSKISEDNPHSNVGLTAESSRKGRYKSKPKKESGLDSKPGTSCPNPKTSKNLAQNVTEKSPESGNCDLAEMPVLDKEEPVRGRTTRKSETEIPVLMPYENEEKTIKNYKDSRGGKRKGVVTFRVVNKRRKSSEKLNPLTIIKETEIVCEKEEEVPKSSKKNENASSEPNKKKRKRNQGFKECGSSQQKLPKISKSKKYFLGICPNEIDKGGDSKDESGSDSEPLITLVMNQKSKEKTEISPDLLLENNTLPTEKTETIEQRGELNLGCDYKEAETNYEKEEKPTPDAEDDEEMKQFSVENKVDSDTLQEEVTLPSHVSDSSSCKMESNAPLPEYELKKQITVKKSLKGLKMTVKLKETPPKIIETSAISLTENETKVSDDGPLEKDKNFEESSNTVPEVSQPKIERRSRRVSKEVKSTNEFVIDDPLILVDELWSELDSDSDNAKKRSKKSKKKFTKRKSYEEKKENSVNLEELLRNFGERKLTKPDDEQKLAAPEQFKRKRKVTTHIEKRNNLENIFKFGQKSYRRLSLRLFKFHKKAENFGTLGQRLLSVKTNYAKEGDTDFKPLPVLPFLAAEVKENPVQIIQCGVQKAKPVKKSTKKTDTKIDCNMQLKISLPLQNINNLAILNNNHLTVVEEVATEVPNSCTVEEISDPTQRDENVINSINTEDDVEPVDVNSKDDDAMESGDLKFKPKRSEVIDKIFSCEICQTYYYSPSQLKIHKSSNRHKLKELELSQSQDKHVEEVQIMEDVIQEKQEVEPHIKIVNEEVNEEDKPSDNVPEESKPTDNAPEENLDLEKLNDDTSEMPILEGPFIENPFVRLGTVMPPAKPPPPTSNVFGFTEDCLKDIQKAIGCTDEEMLILSLLGENSIEIENDILDLDSCQPVAPNPATTKTDNAEEVKERENSNGIFKMDFKKRITSALARLVNKAVLNLLQKYKNTNRTGISPEALSFLIKLSKVNNKKNLLELDELLKNESEGETSTRVFTNDDDKDVSNSYKCLCTVCGTRFPNESAKEWHIIKCHRSQANKNFEETLSDPITVNDGDKEEEVPYSYLCTICGARFQKESTKEIHVIRAHGSKVLKTMEEPSSSPVCIRDDEKKEQNIPYKYLCTICGSRFQKESMWECHIKRSHKSKGKKNVEEVSVTQTGFEDDWSNTWTYDINDELPGNVETPQFLCSDCGINFMSPQEVLEHQKLEHMTQKDIDLNESGPLQSSTIGSSDEIIKGKKGTRRGPKHLSKAELDQQRIIANNELRKLDRKFSKNKTTKPKWGVDALKFTVEKENKVVPEPEEKEIPLAESPKSQLDSKNIDTIPKLNLSRTSNIPEFKVVQKTSCLNRFQRILDNKMKRKSTRNDVKDTEEKDTTEKEFVEPITVVRRERKRKPNRYASKKDIGSKVLDVYDFNDSESEPEPVAFSHVKKGSPSGCHTKLKLIKVKDPNETSKNKPDSTTKDPETEEYDSEDSLPLSLVKRTKTEEEEGEFKAEDQVEKPEGILEQVEYLIEQLENETNQPKSNEEEKNFEKLGNMREDDSDEKKEEMKLDPEYITEEVSIDSQPETFRISLENKFLQLESIAMKKKNPDLNEHIYESQESLSSDEKMDVITNEKTDGILPVADSSQGISDEEDSLPLVLISKKNDTISCDPEFSQNSQKDLIMESPFETHNICEEEEDERERAPSEIGLDSPKNSLDSLSTFSRNYSNLIVDKCEKSFETLNGNVIYRRNDSMSGFDTEMSDYDPLESEKRDSEPDVSESLIKEVMEKEDVVIVCSKKEQDVSKKMKKKQRELPKKRKQSLESGHRKKKILPLLSVTLEENNFRKSESPKLNKDVIMKKIWSRKRFIDDHPDDSEYSLASRDNDAASENFLNDDSHFEIDKEIIMKKIWNKKRLEHDNENGDVQGVKAEDGKINQTEISNEVVIKCGPKAKATPKRKKSRNSTKETSKERIMRKIWSGKCAFQTKAALKTYDSDIIQSPKESGTFEEQHRVKKRGRPPNVLNSKKTKIQSDEEKTDEDDLDSLLEEIEREEVEKAIRLEFLQLRRSDKANVEVAKESGNMTVGLFTETCNKQGRDLGERKRKRIKKNVKHPGKGLLKKRKFIKKSNIKSVQQQPPQQLLEQEDDSTGGVIGFVEERLKNDGESSELALDTSQISYDSESKIKNRKHKKHRHKHHHHKHKHKKSKHRNYVIRKHKMKHKPVDCLKEKSDEFQNFSILEKMCQDIPSQIESQSQKRFSTELESLDRKLDEILMSTSPPFDSKAKECDNSFYEDRSIETERNYGVGGNNVYEFVDDDSGFLCESKGRNKN